MVEENKDDGIRIEGDVATWEFREEGLIAGVYSGTFKFRCHLNPLALIRAGKRYRDLLGANMALATEHESFLAWAICQLKERVISAPPFWSSAADGDLPGDLADEEILRKILEAAIAGENKYKEGLKKRKEEAIERAKAVGEALLEKKRRESKVPDEDGLTPEPENQES
jgi:hypothetical protein